MSKADADAVAKGIEILLGPPTPVFLGEVLSTKTEPTMRLYLVEDQKDNPVYVVAETYQQAINKWSAARHPEIDGGTEPDAIKLVTIYDLIL